MVDLPQPEAPTNAANCPFLICLICVVRLLTKAWCTVRSTYLEINTLKHLGVGSERIRESNFVEIDRTCRVGTLVVVVGSLFDSRLEIVKPEGVVGSIDTLGDAG